MAANLSRRQWKLRRKMFDRKKDADGFRPLRGETARSGGLKPSRRPGRDHFRRGRKSASAQLSAEINKLGTRSNRPKVKTIPISYI